MRRPLPQTAIVCLLLGLAGCGNHRVRAPDPETAQPPSGWRAVAFKASGVRLKAPGNWPLRTGKPPLVTSVFSGAATLSVWRYPRREPLPKSTAALKRARKRLERAARRRDRTLKVKSATIGRIGGARAIVLVASERVSGQLRAVRSAHVFAHRAEVVVDAFAPPDQFSRVDQTVFRPMIASLQVSRPVKPKAHRR